MASYDFREIEKKWQASWKQHANYKTPENFDRPKFYALDMFPYPSGAGLHVGHPLGYIAGDIVSRFKRLKGFNVLHPMGYDAFGLPAEQYAIQTGQHPAVTTEENIKRYREQLDRIGFSFDWSREIRTCDPSYYKWTQWIFVQLFNSWYNRETDKAENISGLISKFEISGCNDDLNQFTAAEWKNFSEKEQSDILLNYRLAFLSEAMVNWCPALGTVLANDEVKDGVSERGGYPVERKLMTQWSLRISAYADRLLKGLDTLDWSDSLKESQRNWIGKSEGSSLFFKNPESKIELEVFTTRPDTVFGVSFLAIAPEHPLLNDLCIGNERDQALAYSEKARNRSERERQAEVKNITGAFTGSYVKHPFTNEDIPVWVADYVLGGYGTGAVMAVPGHDSRDYAFARHFNLPILEVVAGGDLSIEAYEAKTGQLINSSFLDGLEVKDAIKKAIEAIEQKGLGKGKTNFRLRDAVFGRQRYWGEPIPVYYENGVPKCVAESDLPVILPEIDKYLPTETGEPPLARAKDWTYNNHPLELTTMPGWAGSSWYFMRYMDPHNETAFASKENLNYWQNIDLYIGGSEHATGHLLYFRFWTKFLYDMGHVPFDEPAKKLINQGMIQGVSSLIHRINNTNKFVSAGLKGEYETTAIHIDIKLVTNNNQVDIEALKQWRPSEFENAEFILENGILICDSEVGKMSKRWHNVVNPDDVCDNYGADTLRLYEMFLGPLQDAKPWSTQGIEGVLRFLRKLWRLFHNNPEESFVLSDEEPSKAEYKTLHKTIKKATEDIENFSFNTSVSAFMVCINELQDLKCNKRKILEPLLIILSPYAPHIAEELWSLCGHNTSINNAEWPAFNGEYLIENEFNYPISFNGKVRFNLNFALDMDPKAMETEILANEQTSKYLEGKAPKKVIVVKGKIVNIVI
ncbi:MAG TPA: leucine--tRNA ligase [Bacteroidia bacterium]